MYHACRDRVGYHPGVRCELSPPHAGARAVAGSLPWSPLSLSTALSVASPQTFNVEGASFIQRNFDYRSHFAIVQLLRNHERAFEVVKQYLAQRRFVLHRMIHPFA